MISRGPLTDLLLFTLAAGVGPVVGDGEVPTTAHGWSGDPNAPASVFRPYLVLMPMTAGGPDGPLGDTTADWQVPYQVQSYGVARNQCEWIADKARGLLAELRGALVALGTSSYKVQQVRPTSIGGINRMDAFDPPYFGQADGIVVWLTKERD